MVKHDRGVFECEVGTCRYDLLLVGDGNHGDDGPDYDEENERQAPDTELLQMEEWWPCCTRFPVINYGRDCRTSCSSIFLNA